MRTVTTSDGGLMKMSLRKASDRLIVRQTDPLICNVVTAGQSDLHSLIVMCNFLEIAQDESLYGSKITQTIV